MNIILPSLYFVIKPGSEFIVSIMNGIPHKLGGLCRSHI